MFLNLALLFSALPSAFGAIGSCNFSVNITVDSNCDLNEFFKMNSGVISYKSVPDTDPYKDVERMTLYSYKLTEHGVFRAAVIMEESTGPPQLLSAQIRYDTNASYTRSKEITGTQEFFQFCLAYEPDEFAYILACGTEPNDTSTDYRYVLGNKNLSAIALSKIEALENQGFKGSMRWLAQEDKCYFNDTC